MSSFSLTQRLQTKSVWILSWLFLFLLPNKTWAYPEFIAYGTGYTSCTMCHWNSLGSGALSDYGRGVWSGEIASRALYPNRMSDDQISEQSGFLGKPDRLPWWLRPSLKYRGMQLRRDPGGPGDTSKFYQMQVDVGLALLSNPEGKWMAVFTAGHVPNTETLGTTKMRMMPREYYIRWNPADGWFVYAGLLEKAYGLRNIDHSSYQRTYQLFSVFPNSGMGHSLGAIIHRESEKWQVAVNGFSGNPNEDKEVQHKGGSLFSEFKLGEATYGGLSLHSSSNDSQTKEMAALHLKEMVFQGSSILFEYGYIKDKSKTDNTVQAGTYNFLEGFIKLVRGYHLTTMLERRNADFNPSTNDQWRWGFGFLAFPAPRLELRVNFIDQRSFSDKQAGDDAWAVQGQVHVSL